MLKKEVPPRVKTCAGAPYLGKSTCKFIHIFTEIFSLVAFKEESVCGKNHYGRDTDLPDGFLFYILFMSADW
ncbi:MAG: hypothetical protein AYK18_13795 [Theionarchaea archaeon DG-70]|nr:MAG: hypothetical protein AYK18_13795 [Theionarchaea archaeon DG-70]MBU7027354.1 hypothetical protein [Theionarchaea archaeon]